MKNFKTHSKPTSLFIFILFLTMFTFSSAQDQGSKSETADSKYKHHTSTYGPILACNGSPKDCFVLNGRIHILKEDSSIGDDH